MKPGNTHEKLRSPDGQALREAADAITAGKLVAFATETVYGLGADATNPEAVARVFAAKARPKIDPLIVHVTSIEQARDLTTAWPALAEQLAQAFWPGPLTMVLPKADVVPSIVTGGLDHVGLRMPSHPLARKLIAAAGRPIAAPSANRFGRISPTRVEHVIAELGDQDDLVMVLDGGPCEHGVESTVVRLDTSAEGGSEGGEPLIHVLRLGGLPVEALEQFGKVNVIRVSEAETSQRSLASPGMITRHYAPGTPLSVVADAPGLMQALPTNASERVGVLCLNRQACGEGLAADIFVRELSSSGDLIEAAANLFEAMRAMDSMSLDRIFAVSVPATGLGLAINDRLQRASQR